MSSEGRSNEPFLLFCSTPVHRHFCHISGILGSNRFNLSFPDILGVTAFDSQVIWIVSTVCFRLTLLFLDFFAFLPFVPLTLPQLRQLYVLPQL